MVALVGDEVPGQHSLAVVLMGWVAAGDMGELMAGRAAERANELAAERANELHVAGLVREGRGGFGEDFDFFYLTGPADFARFFGLTGTGDADKIRAYFDQRVASDSELMSAVAARKLSKTGFRNYYALRASVAFSLGSHDEWNISHILNERRRASDQFGIGNQIAIMFDGHGVTPGQFRGCSGGWQCGALQLAESERCLPRSHCCSMNDFASAGWVQVFHFGQAAFWVAGRDKMAQPDCQ